MRIIDLTQKIYSGMPVYTGDPEVKITQRFELDGKGYTVHKIEIGDQTGTHVETQAHMIQGRMLEDEPLERFIGMSTIVDVPCGPIDSSDLNVIEDNLHRCEFLLLRSRYSDKIQTIDVHDEDRPLLTIGAAKWLVDKGVRLIGIDCFDFDTGPSYEAHKYLFKHNILIVEGLNNLSSIRKKIFRLFVIPLKIENASASPCRAFAIEE